jgi:hypothetical protein
MMKAFCKWWRPQCLFEGIQLSLKKDGDTVAVNAEIRTFSAKRSELKNNQIYNARWCFPAWRYLEGDQAGVMNYHWIGKNPRTGTELTLSVGGWIDVNFNTTGTVISSEPDLSAFNFIRRFTSNDTELGAARVFYCDPANGLGKWYFTGNIFRFRLKERSSSDAICSSFQ